MIELIGKLSFQHKFPSLISRSPGRFGQKKNVFIYKLVVPDTVEARIQEVRRRLTLLVRLILTDRFTQLQEKKRQLATSALTGEKLGKKQQKLGMDELMNLFAHDG